MSHDANIQSAALTIINSIVARGGVGAVMPAYDARDQVQAVVVVAIREHAKAIMDHADRILGEDADAHPSPPVPIQPSPVETPKVHPPGQCVIKFEIKMQDGKMVDLDHLYLATGADIRDCWFAVMMLNAFCDTVLAKIRDVHPQGEDAKVRAELSAIFAAVNTVSAAVPSSSAAGLKMARDAMAKMGYPIKDRQEDRHE